MTGIIPKEILVLCKYKNHMITDNIPISQDTWYCYILRNTQPQYKNCTYNGSTNNPIRRLRQHNGIIKGGAVRTTQKGGGWEIYALLSGFKDHKNALSAEWRIAHPSGKPGKKSPEFYGMENRIKSLNQILALEQWTKQCTVNNSECSYRLVVLEDVEHLLDRDKIPANVIIEIFGQKP